jgi:hypothetical protein
MMRLHCGIYKSSYNISNISYLNSPPPFRRAQQVLGGRDWKQWKEEGCGEEVE